MWTQGGTVDSSSCRSPASYLTVLHLHDDPKPRQYDSLSTHSSPAVSWSLYKEIVSNANRDNCYDQDRLIVPSWHLTTLLSKFWMWLVKYPAGSKNEFIHFLLSALEVSNSYQCLRKLYFWIVLSKRLTKLFFIYSLFALWIWRIEDLWSLFNFILNKTQRQLFCKSGILADCQFLLAGYKTTNRNKMPFFILCLAFPVESLSEKRNQTSPRTFSTPACCVHNSSGNFRGNFASKKS